MIEGKDAAGLGTDKRLGWNDYNMMDHLFILSNTEEYHQFLSVGQAPSLLSSSYMIKAKSMATEHALLTDMNGYLHLPSLTHVHLYAEGWREGSPLSLVLFQVLFPFSPLQVPMYPYPFVKRFACQPTSELAPSRLA